MSGDPDTWAVVEGKVHRYGAGWKTRCGLNTGNATFIWFTDRPNWESTRKCEVCFA